MQQLCWWTIINFKVPKAFRRGGGNTEIQQQCTTVMHKSEKQSNTGQLASLCYLGKTSSWRAKITLKLHPSFNPNKNLDTQPLDVDMQTVEVELSGQGKKYLGILPKSSPVVGSKVYPPSLSVMLH